MCAISSDYYTQTIGSFDPVGKVESLQTALLNSERSVKFSYNTLGELTDDGAHRYSCDSHYNRLLQDNVSIQVDSLNQLCGLEYDADGNPIQKNGLRLSYDALDRLVSIDFPNRSRISYTYDPFHRRLTKTQGSQTTRFLYDGNHEIGFEKRGELSIRILGETPQAEIGSAVAMRLEGIWCVPLHDLQGSVAALIDPKTKHSLEECLYTPFGESSRAISNNPWRYLSKHTDDETSLVFFGRRYYDPASGRFLTTDPKGYTDSSNLYTFALNDPFMQIDPYGLENEPSQMAGETFLSDAGMITVRTMRGAFTGAWNGFAHPIDSMSSIGNDLLFLGNSMVNGNTAMLSAAWLAMDWEERLHFGFFQSARIAGVGVAVAGLGELYQGARLGVMAAMAGGKTLLQMAERWGVKSSVGNVSAVETIVAKQLPNPYTGIQQASRYLREMGFSREKRLKVLQSFQPESIAMRHAGDAEFGLRYFQDSTRMAGPYLFETFPASRASLAIKPEWNTMTGFMQFQIRPGILYLEGRAASQGPYLMGGQIQKHIFNWREDLLIK